MDRNRQRKKSGQRAIERHIYIARNRHMEKYREINDGISIDRWIQRDRDIYRDIKSYKDRYIAGWAYVWIEGCRNEERESDVGRDGQIKRARYREMCGERERERQRENYIDMGVTLCLSLTRISPSLCLSLTLFPRYEPISISLSLALSLCLQLDSSLFSRLYTLLAGA